MANSVLDVGDIRVTSLSDGGVVFDPRLMFPETSLEHWSHYYEIFPECFSGQHFLMNLGVFVMSSGGKNVIADTGFGPHGKMLGSETSAELMDDFARKGMKTDEIDTVFMSHLHADHVGWNIDPATSRMCQRSRMLGTRFIVRIGIISLFRMMTASLGWSRSSGA